LLGDYLGVARQVSCSVTESLGKSLGESLEEFIEPPRDKTSPSHQPGTDSKRDHFLS
jgi:hypothetical protein